MRPGSISQSATVKIKPRAFLVMGSLIMGRRGRIVNVLVISPETHSEHPFELDISVGEHKLNLELITGIPVANQIVSHFDSEDDVRSIATLTANSRPLWFYDIKDGQVLQVEDCTSPTAMDSNTSPSTSRINPMEVISAKVSVPLILLISSLLHNTGSVSTVTVRKRPLAGYVANICASKYCANANDVCAGMEKY